MLQILPAVLHFSGLSSIYMSKNNRQKVIKYTENVTKNPIDINGYGEGFTKRKFKPRENGSKIVKMLQNLCTYTI